MQVPPSRRGKVERILTKKELRELIPYTSQHIARLEKAGGFPKRVRLGPNRVGWFESEILIWQQTLGSARFGNGEGSNEPATE